MRNLQEANSTAWIGRMTTDRAIRKVEKTKSRKLKLLVLTTTYPSDENDPSGIFIAKLLASMRSRGYSIKVVAPSNGIFHGRKVLDGIETIRFGYFWPRSLEKLTTTAGGIPENMANSLLAKIQLIPMMAAFLFTSLSEIRGMHAIYANWLGSGIIGAVANLLTGKPLVVSFRGDDGYLARDRFLWRVLTKWVINRSAAIAPVSRELGEIMLSLGAPRRKCHVPRFGIDTEMFRPSDTPLSDRETVRLLFVGSLIVRKGLHDLINILTDSAFKRVILTVVGDGVYGPELKLQVRKLGLESRVEWKGILPPAEVAVLMRKSDILCLPSYMEGRPNVVNEAMASGLPVISTRIGGIPDMVVEGETALLFNPGDLPALKQCLEKLVSNRELRQKMGKAGREFLMKSGVSWDSTAEEFDALFSKIVKR